MQKLNRTIAWWIFGILSISIGLYPLIYFLLERNFGLLTTKSEELLSDTLWSIGFNGHIIFGGLALLVGWIQFSKKLRIKQIKLHRFVGYVYVMAAIISGICGVYIAFFATGGWISSMGFICLGIIWLSSTGYAFLLIKKTKINAHERMMIFSYAACFAAVTLRIWLPMLIALFGEFVPAYRVVAWLCWVPNIIVAALIVRRKAKQNSVTFG